jgi:hypothetical protein
LDCCFAVDEVDDEGKLESILCGKTIGKTGRFKKNE